MNEVRNISVSSTKFWKADFILSILNSPLISIIIGILYRVDSSSSIEEKYIILWEGDNGYSSFSSAFLRWLISLFTINGTNSSIVGWSNTWLIGIL